ncbi:MAG: MFS transporter, partial [Chloroflexota bacterium]|nr:MFS transporter [Chloroflexota bacterium]
MAHVVPADSSTSTVPRIDTRRWLTLVLVLGGTFMTFFDLSVVNVAIPTVQRDLHASFAQVQFVIAGYALTYAVTLITGGRLGDIYGRKRVFMLGMAGFTLASALCGFAPSPDLLIGARLIQGLAAAVMTPQVLSIIQVTFTPEVRSRALGIFGAVVGVAAMLGQVLGGLIIRANLFGFSWRPIFLVNLPVGIGALAAATFLLAESRSATARRLDLGGVCIVTLGLFLLIYPLVEGREAGWPLWTWLCLLAALPVLVAFVAFEQWMTKKVGSPLVVLRLFRLPAFVAGLRVQCAFTCANAAFLFTLALYLQLGLHFSALAAGLTFGPAPVAVLIVAPLAGKLAADLGRRLIVSGIALL